MCFSNLQGVLLGIRRFGSRGSKWYIGPQLYETYGVLRCAWKVAIEQGYLNFHSQQGEKELSTTSSFLAPHFGTRTHQLHHQFASKEISTMSSWFQRPLRERNVKIPPDDLWEKTRWRGASVDGRGKPYYEVEASVALRFVKLFFLEV